MKFTKDQYIDFVADWKLRYKEHSQEIRNIRVSFKAASSLFSKTSYKEHASYWAAWKEMERLRDYLFKLRLEATSLINERHQSKIDAQESYLAEKADK